ncbi:MAG TPA: S9 family peptidase [Gemmatimonadales bacterium]|nr:S9 family peptidase [Gemmatimonadales bacterium]
MPIRTARRLAAGPLLLVPALLSAQGAHPLAVDDFFALKSVGAPSLSPDGRYVAYSLATPDLKKDRSATRIWMAPTAGGEAIPLTAAGAPGSSPKWSPDGKYLGFRAARNGGESQVWTLNRLGGEAEQLTLVKQGIEDFEWSPDGKRLLLTIRDPKPERPKADSGGAETPLPIVVDRLQFKRDNQGYLDRRRPHLYVFEPATKQLRQITSGDFDDSDGVWSPDGKLVAFTSNRTEEPDNNRNSDLWIVAADNTDQGRTLRRLTTNPGSDDSPAWSPDGKSIAYVTQTDLHAMWYATRHLAVIPSAGGTPALPTKTLDRNVSSPRYSPDGAGILFLLEDQGERHLTRIPAGGGAITRVVGGARSVTAFDVAPDGRIAVRAAEPRFPGELFAVGVGGTLARLTHANDSLLGRVRLAEVEKIRFKSRDGTGIEGFLYYPVGYQKSLKYPTLLRIHGGPVSQFEAAFNFEAQLFAANGYAVVTVNPRGSSGYGQAFSEAIFADWGNKDFEDVMAGVDFALARGIADSARLGVGGWSYGGILTDYVITKSTRFKGAISGASEALIVANYGHDHYQQEYEAELGLPWKNRAVYEKLSSFNDVEKIVTPTLWMGGSEDWNVPILNSEQMYQAMKRLGRTTELVVYPGEHHGIARPTFQKDRLERYLAWYGKYVKGGPPPSP